MLRHFFLNFFSFAFITALYGSAFTDCAQEFENTFSTISPIEWRTMENGSSCVLRTKKIVLPGFPAAFNPSLIKVDEGFLFSFRFMSARHHQPWISHIGLVLLNDSLEPISDPVLLDTRSFDNRTPTQSEDARLFTFQGKVYLIYNDNMEMINPSALHRRDIYIAEVIRSGGHYSVGVPIKCCHTQRYKFQNWQKNWVPFEWEGELYLGYSMVPHEVLKPNLQTGACEPLYTTNSPFLWNLGTPRGSSSPCIDEGEYFAFFHSGTITPSGASSWRDLWHYFMGAYCFTSGPPFKITKMTPKPIVAHGFYTNSGHEKRVIFPGGFAISGNLIHVAYGRDDCEMWIATLDKKELKRSMIQVAH